MSQFLIDGCQFCVGLCNQCIGWYLGVDVDCGGIQWFCIDFVVGGLYVDLCGWYGYDCDIVVFIGWIVVDVVGYYYDVVGDWRQ